MRTSTVSTLKRIIKEEIARQTGKRRSAGNRKLTEARYSEGDFVVTNPDTKEEDEIVDVYDNFGKAILAAIENDEIESVEMIVSLLAKNPKLAVLPCYRMDGDSMIYHEKMLKTPSNKR